MADYQLELRQVVDYPRCRIYREFIQTLIADRSIRTGGCSGLFYYVVLCSYANFRTSYTCDFPRIRRFDTALELHGMTGTLICFDYQEEALREICGQCVMLQSIDFQQFERSVLYS